MGVLFLAGFGEVMSFILYILIALLVLLVMITVHEFGHYITGKIFKFKIEEFAIGFGPKIFRKEKKNGELFSIRAFPLGGFCAFYGEETEEFDPNAFNNKKPWQRIIVLVSGALMNYIFSVLIIMLTFFAYGHTAIMAYETDETALYGVEQRLENRDVILEINGKNAYLSNDVMKILDGTKKGETVNALVIRQGKKINLTLEMLEDANFSSLEDTLTLCKVLGITYGVDENGKLSETGFRSTGVQLGFLDTVGKSFEYSFKIAGTVFTVFKQLITGKIGLNSVGGTVTTISVTATAIQNGGLWSLLSITSMIGVNLAVFNLLPIPALDGSHALFTLIEWIRRKPINKKVENVIHAVGFVLLILFAIVVDLQQCF